LQQIKDSMLGSFDSKEKDAHTKILTFLIQVRDVLNDKWTELLADKIRKAVLGDAPKDIFPLETIKVINFDIGETPEIDYVLVIEKAAPQHTISQSVNQDLFSEHLKTNKDLATIIQEKKEAGDNRYEYITGASKKKWFFDCQLDLFVDYSPKR
jgi:hypothetical protein